MSDYVIEISGLSKRYGAIMAVDGLDMKVKRGEVYGFVGPNGAGKTTTLRMLLGLVRPTSGSCQVLGERPGAPSVLAQVGALVETPAFYPYLCGRDNLHVLALNAGIADSRIDPALDEVELLERAGDRFTNYSLGMKQRLGMAAALLKDPELLILDEPTNGLDPSGIAEMRNLIRSLGRGDRTVLLSSHLMGELEQICDRVGIVKAGKLIREGTVQELIRGDRLGVRAQPAEKAKALMEAMEGVSKVESVPGGRLMIEADPSLAAGIVKLLVDSGVEVSEIAVAKTSLESAFLSLTEDEPHHG
ncbi:MAG: ABC transporter ATP-binding protein [Actinobacteria bacterium]|nr:ABC transporter ATP-binding protein [Actinomycetota bacterium]MCL5882483.1 ABC transporter ATP-binding protein [Actinomycetota bacterium]